MADLAEGAQGHDVEALQTALVAKGYFVGNVDGWFGPRTAHAVGYFQSCNGLHIDRTAGHETRLLLGIGAAAPRFEMRMVEAHVDNDARWYIPLSASRELVTLRVVGLFSAGSAQATSETTAETHLAGSIIFLPIPEDVRSHKGEEVHVHVTAYLDNVLVDEKAGSFFIT